MATRHDVEYIRSALDYDPSTGIFRWTRPASPQMRPGSIAGTPKGDGYRVIMVSRRRYAAHRLAWLYVHGEMPPGNLDHINGDRDDNRIVNLRLATPSQNAMNRKMRSDNATGYRGVYREVQSGKYRAAIGVNRKILQLGRFDTPEEAFAAYCAKARELHGEFSRA